MRHTLFMKVCLLCDKLLPNKVDNRLNKEVHNQCLKDLENNEYLPMMREVMLYRFKQNKRFEDFMINIIRPQEFIKTIVEISNNKYGI